MRLSLKKLRSQFVIVIVIVAVAVVLMLIVTFIVAGGYFSDVLNEAYVSSCPNRKKGTHMFNVLIF